MTLSGFSDKFAQATCHLTWHLAFLIARVCARSVLQLTRRRSVGLQMKVMAEPKNLMVGADRRLSWSESKKKPRQGDTGASSKDDPRLGGWTALRQVERVRLRAN